MTLTMTDGPRQTQLIARAQAGDRRAFDELVEKLQGRVRSFIRSRIKSGRAIDADEVLQETLVRAFKSLKSFRGLDQDDFRRWLTGVASKTVLRFEEEGRRRPTVTIEGDVAADAPTPSKALAQPFSTCALRICWLFGSCQRRYAFWTSRSAGSRAQ
jgi:RNA polymerase sigma factor (sigma-70 family)